MQKENAMEGIGITIVHGDARSVPADALVLKYTQSNRGLEGEIVKDLEVSGRHVVDDLPPQHAYFIADSDALTNTTKIVFIGVPELRLFGYKEIREFGKRSLAALSHSQPTAKSVIMTVHGTGYGLDEQEAFEAQLAGLLESIRNRNIPPQLNEICFVEKQFARAKRLQKYLEKYFPERRIPSPWKAERRKLEKGSLESLDLIGNESDEKKRVFVAMPFEPEYEDYFHYGIKNVVNDLGYLCERADMAAFTGDIMEWVKTRIKGAEFVIADLTNANPNVYLEVGYAWGKNKKTILIIHNHSELKFDTRGQKCIRYESIKDLESKLRSDLPLFVHHK